MILSAEQVQQFHEEGYLVFPGLITGESWDRHMTVFRELVAHSRTLHEPSEHFSLAPDDTGKPTPGRLHKIQGVCVVEDVDSQATFTRFPCFTTTLSCPLASSPARAL